MNVRELPEDQDWISDRMIAYGYHANKNGICLGVAVTFAEAFANGGMQGIQAVNRDFNKTYEIAIEDFKHEKETREAEKKLSEFVSSNISQIKSEALSELNARVNREREKEQHITLIENELDQKQKEQFEKMVTSIVGDQMIMAYPKEYSLMKSRILFDVIEIYFQADRFPHLFEKDKIPRIQNILESSRVFRSQKKEEQHDIFAISQQPVTGIYHKDEVLTYFQSLRAIFENDTPPLTNPVSIILSSGDHSIFVGFDPKTKQWVFGNANKMPAIVVSSDSMMASYVCHAFSSNDVAAFSAEFIVNPAYESELNNKLHAWSLTNEYQSIHTITNEKLHLQDSNGVTLLNLAASNGDLELVNKLLLSDEIQALINCQDTTSGSTPLYSAVARQHYEIAYRLLEYGADPNILRKNGASPLFVAVLQNEPIEVVIKLLRHGADPNHLFDGESLLHDAILIPNVEVVELLLEHDANPNPKSTFDTNPLILAVKFGYEEIVSLLLKYGADLTLKLEGKSALDVAIENGNKAMIGILESHIDEKKKQQEAYVKLQSRKDEVANKSRLFKDELESVTKVLSVDANRKKAISLLHQKMDELDISDSLTQSIDENSVHHAELFLSTLMRIDIYTKYLVDLNIRTIHLFINEAYQQLMNGCDGEDVIKKLIADVSKLGQSESKKSHFFLHFSGQTPDIKINQAIQKANEEIKENLIATIKAPLKL